MPEEILSTTALDENKKETGLDYYHNILEPLFFQVLNTPVEERNKPFRKAPWKLVPFLNGGLFTPHDDDFYKPGAMGLSENINTLKIMAF